MSLTGGGNPSQWFFLAMAHKRRGNAAEADKWMNQALRWMKENQTEDQQLRIFRQEAAQLLGWPGSLLDDGENSTGAAKDNSEEAADSATQQTGGR